MENRSSNKAFEMFYSMLREIQASNRCDPKAASMVVRNGEYLEKILAPLQTLHIPFSGEEEFGRYLDLHELYNIFINSKFGFSLTYTKYLDIFPAVDDESMISAKHKNTQQYKDYVVRVLDYLVSFINRAEPLMFLDRLFKNLDSEFEDRSRRVGQKRPRATATTALMEVKVIKLCEILKDTLERTRQHVKNRQGMTAKELAQDREANHDDDNVDDDGETENCKKKKLFPLGWDGKPIPYWLYKLHGLNQEFKCEICGNSTYKGRRAFEKHFHEERHRVGMRCLGIPNTNSFREITEIEDAKRLWHHIQLTQESSQWNPDLYEEYEDAQGNVYSKKMYDDLVKQGLI